MRTEIINIKQNIVLCKTGEKDNPFSLVLPEAKQVKTDGEAEIFAETIGEKTRFVKKPKQTLFVQSSVDFSPVDVMKYTSDGPPQVEVIKTVDGSRSVINNLVKQKSRDSSQITLTLEFAASDNLFGLGQDEYGAYNKRKTKQYLYQHNMITPVPFLVSDKGYGVFFDAACLMIFDDTKGTTKIVFDTLDSLEYYIITGNMDDIIAGFRYLTGRAVMLPKWAFGYMQSKERYKTAEELAAVVHEYRERRIPIDCIIQDWKTWEGDLWGEKILDKTRFADIKETNAEIHDMHVHTMVSVWPNMNAGGQNHAEFEKAGFLLNDYSTYDAFSEKARQMYWHQAKSELFDGGFDAWWCDSTEPFTAPDWCGVPKRSEIERYKLVGEEHKKYLDPAMANAYALVHAKGIYENQRAETDEKRVLNLTRSGYPGIQRYGAVLWAGDTSASWQELKWEIAKGLSMGLSGLPYWTVDIGAFFVGGTACWRKWKEDATADPVWFWNGHYDDGVLDEKYRELYVRWLQFGVFLPIFRSHGTDTPREIWQFGEPGTPYYDAIRCAIEIRYELIEYIYSMSARVTHAHYTMMRSLLFDFAEDEMACSISDEFMFGDSLLVCPITQPSAAAQHRVCYLPKGAGWIDYWTKEFYEGGRPINVNSRLDRIPVFVKAGSIIPLVKNKQYAEQKADEIELHIFPGEDARFDLYIDEGDGYAYESGLRHSIKMVWDDDKAILTFEAIEETKTDFTFYVIQGSKQTLIKYTGKRKQVCINK